MRAIQAPAARLLGAVICLLLLLGSTLPVLAAEEGETEGYRADTLTIEVGYAGGPYYEKHVFTLEELWAMDLVRADYTLIDNMPAVVIDHVVGVRLSDLMDAAGIDLNSVQTFHFWTLDKESDKFTSYTKAELIDTVRYCYYSLPMNFDSDLGAGNELAALVAEPVPTVIALADDWNRYIAGAQFGSDYENLNTNTRFRLMIGQTNTTVRTADRSAKWIHKIVVQLGGAPTLTVGDASVLELEVGSVHRTQARVQAADPVISQGAEITWSSSDERIATVDGDGNITVHREGTAVITASYGEISAAITVNGTGEESASSQATGSGGTSDPQEPPADGGGAEEAPPTSETADGDAAKTTVL